MYKPKAVEIFRNHLAIHGLALCLWMPLLSEGQQPATTIQLFISESLGQRAITDILRTLPEDRSVSVTVRGLLPGNKSLNRTIWYWQTILEQSGTSHGIQIDPVAFSDAGVTQVPALLLSENNKPLLKVLGVTSTEWLLRQFRIGHRGNLGQKGGLYPVSEPDLLEVLLQRLKQQDWQAIQAKARRRLQRKILSFGAALPTSRQASNKVLNISGHWHTPMIALDINDRQQQKAVVPWLRQHTDALVLVSSGSFQKLQKLQKLPAVWQQHLIYIMPAELVRRFQLTALPALLTPEN